MRVTRLLVGGLIATAGSVSLAQYQSLQAQNQALFQQLQRVRGLSDTQMSAVRSIFAKSGYIGQGNPAITKHPVTPEACQAKLDQMGVHYETPRFEQICKGKYIGAAVRSGHPATGRRQGLHRSVRVP